jgi:hypothetical protein
MFAAAGMRPCGAPFLATSPYCVTYLQWTYTIDAACPSLL